MVYFCLYKIIYNILLTFLSNPLNILYIDPYNKPGEITVVSKADLRDKIRALSHAVGPMARRTNGP